MLNFAEIFEIVKPLAIFIVGITIYSVFIFKFYRFLAREDIFKLNLRQYNRFKHKVWKKFISILLYITEYLLIFPVFIFFWSSIIAGLLLFLSKTHTIGEVLVISVAVVGAIRFTAYYNEDLSKDLAKMLPFALLGIFLVDTTYLSFSETMTKLSLIPTFSNYIIYYFALVMLLELILRIIHTITLSIGEEKPKNDEFIIK